MNCPYCERPMPEDESTWWTHKLTQEWFCSEECANGHCEGIIDLRRIPGLVYQARNEGIVENPKQPSKKETKMTEGRKPRKTMVQRKIIVSRNGEPWAIVEGGERFEGPGATENAFKAAMEDDPDRVVIDKVRKSQEGLVNGLLGNSKPKKA